MSFNGMCCPYLAHLGILDEINEHTKKLQKISISLTCGIYIYAPFTKTLETLRLLNSRLLSQAQTRLLSSRLPFPAQILSFLPDSSIMMSHKHLKSSKSKMEFIFSTPVSPPVFPISIQSPYQSGSTRRQKTHSNLNKK